jgi:hypothetical protein
MNISELLVMTFFIFLLIISIYHFPDLYFKEKKEVEQKATKENYLDLMLCH